MEDNTNKTKLLAKNLKVNSRESLDLDDPQSYYDNFLIFEEVKKTPLNASEDISNETNKNKETQSSLLPSHENTLIPNPNRVKLHRGSSILKTSGNYQLNFLNTKVNKKISFNEKISHTINIENWKDYNKIESYPAADDECSCHCLLI